MAWEDGLSRARGPRSMALRDLPKAPLESTARSCLHLSDSGFPDWLWFASLLMRQVWGSQTGMPHPIELRTRVVADVDEGRGHREAARHFRVSPKFVNELIKLRHRQGRDHTR